MRRQTASIAQASFPAALRDRARPATARVIDRGGAVAAG